MCSGWQYGQERESNNVTLSSCASRKDLCTLRMRDNEVVPFFFEKKNLSLFFAYPMVAIDSTERYLSTIVSIKETKVICSSVLHFQRWKDFTMVTNLTLNLIDK